MNAEQKDIRWEQRFSNYAKAFRKLASAVDVVKEAMEGDQIQIGESLQEILKEGLIQRFEYTYQLAWNVMKDYAEYQGNNEIGGSRDATREAFKMGLITDAESWMDMIKSRNETSHTYNEKIANAIVEAILARYVTEFKAFQQHLLELERKEAK